MREFVQNLGAAIRQDPAEMEDPTQRAGLARLLRPTNDGVAQDALLAIAQSAFNPGQGQTSTTRNVLNSVLAGGQALSSGDKAAASLARETTQQGTENAFQQAQIDNEARRGEALNRLTGAQTQGVRNVNEAFLTDKQLERQTIKTNNDYQRALMSKVNAGTAATAQEIMIVEEQRNARLAQIKAQTASLNAQAAATDPRQAFRAKADVLSDLAELSGMDERAAALYAAQSLSNQPTPDEVVGELLQAQAFFGPPTAEQAKATRDIVYSVLGAQASTGGEGAEGAGGAQPLNILTMTPEQRTDAAIRAAKARGITNPTQEQIDAVIARAMKSAQGAAQ